MEQKDKKTGKKNWWKAGLFIIVLVLLYALSKYYQWDIFEASNVTKLQTTAAEHMLTASIIYLLATMVGSVLLALPGFSFAVVSAVVFGPWLGTVLCVLAATLGAIASFLAGRYFLKDAMEPLVRKNRYLNKLLFENSEKNALYLLMVTRLLPVFPYNLQNFAYGITAIRFLPFSLYSFIFMIPGTAMFCFGTAGIADEGNRFLYLGLTAILIIFVFGSSFLLKRYMEKRDGSGL